MINIYNLQERANALRKRYIAASITPEEVGGLIADTLEFISLMERNTSSLGITKVYNSIAAMEGDKSPNVDGKPLRQGQLVSIYNAENKADIHNGDIYMYDKDGWSFVSNIANVIVGSSPWQAYSGAKGQTLEENLTQETSARTTAITEVKEKIDSEVTKLVERLSTLENKKPSEELYNILEFDGFTGSVVTQSVQESVTGDFKVLFDVENKRFFAFADEQYYSGWLSNPEKGITDRTYQSFADGKPYSNKVYVNKADNLLYRWDGKELIQVGVNNENSANQKANYVKIEVDLTPTFVKGGFVDNKNSVVNYANTSYCKDLSVKGFDVIKTNAGWFSNARTLLLDDDGRVLKNVAYENENGNSISEKVIDLKEFPNVAKISISTGHENTYVIAQKTTKKLIQDYLLENDLSKITELEDELKPLTIFTRSEGFYNDRLAWSSVANKFSVKHTDISLLKVNEGMKFQYKGNAIGSAVNYAFFDESKNKVSSVVGKDLRAGVEIVIPAGVKYVFFQSFSTDANPESVVFSLVTKDWFRAYIESLVDVKTLNMLKASNVLWGKKYVAIGDSFTDAIGTEKITEDGIFKGSPKVYPYIIGNRNNMGVLNQGASGTTLNQYIVNRKFESIPNDVDYITIWFGINDKGHGVQIGSATDKVEAWSNEKSGSTGAAFNYIFEWIFTNRPFAHVGVVVTDFAEQERRNVIIECCKRWGVAFLDLYNPTIPMIRTRGEQIEIDPKIKEIRNKQFSLNGVKDMHPNNKAHQWQSTIVENFMRGL